MTYLIPVYRSLTIAGVLLLAAACDHASALLQTTSPNQNGVPIDLEEGKCINITYPVQEVVLGAVVDPDDLMDVGWDDTSVSACCVRPGTGTMQVTMMTNNGVVYKSFPSTCRLPPLPLPEAPRRGIWVNVSGSFRAIGRSVERLAVSPEDLTSQSTRNALFVNQMRAAASTADQAVISADAGDIGFVCEREGEGSIEVSFNDGGRSPIKYSLTCQDHDQGGGG